MSGSEDVDLLVYPAPGYRATDISTSIHGLEDPKANRDARVKAADRLGRSGGGDLVVKALLRALHDPHAPVRRAAARSLGRIGDLRGVGPLVGLLQDPDDDVRCRAAIALGETRDVTAVGPLADVLGDEDEDVRQRAREALERIRESPVF